MMGSDPFGHPNVLHWLIVVTVAVILFYPPWMPRR